MSKYLIFLLLYNYTFGIDLKIKLYSTKKSDRCIISIQKGKAFLVALDNNDDVIDTISSISNNKVSLKTLYIISNRNNISVGHINRGLGVFKKIAILSYNDETIYNIRYSSEDRTYQGDLIFYNKNDHIEIINEINIEQYVGGVVESEGGHCYYPEYLKAQAILARTYSIKNMNKFISEGYNLTDDVRSQVYHSRPYLKHSTQIIEAVEKTKGLVLFNKNGDIVDAVFHANSGGETVDPVYVWKTDGKSYLKSIIDNHSIGHGSYSWEKIVPKKKLFSFFDNYKDLQKNKYFREKITNLKQGNSRLNVLKFNNIEIKLADLRNYLKLKSTFFDISDMGNENVLIKGKGFGHGIGLSQDGAIKMAEKGFHYGEIINFYYTNIIMDDYNKVLK